MYKVTIIQRQGRNSEYTTTERARIQGDFLELRLVAMTKFIALHGVEEITEIEIQDTDEGTEGDR